MAGNESLIPAKGDPFYAGVTGNGSDSRYEKGTFEPDHVKPADDPFFNDERPVPPTYASSLCADVDGTEEILAISGTYPNHIYTGTTIRIEQRTFSTWEIFVSDVLTYWGFAATPAEVTYWNKDTGTPDVTIGDLSTIVKYRVDDCPIKLRAGGFLQLRANEN